MNNTTKHTPGPWEVVGSRICTVANDIERITLAKTEPGGAFAMSEQQEANATLLAAAPAMYEALKGMVSMYDSLNKSNKHDGACPCYHCQARTALAQAEGRDK